MIYVYRCSECGHEEEVRQRLSDAPLITCMACGEETLDKVPQCTDFQLKGVGWARDGYATDTNTHK